MSLPFSRVSASLLLFLVAGCDPEDPGEPGGEIPECAESATPYVLVQFDVPEDVTVAEDDVIWSDGAESGVCPSVSAGVWRCDAPAGLVDVTVHLAGHKRAFETVEVPESGCMPTVEPTLERLGEAFAEDRAYYIQWIEDDDECARSWELYEMNCFATAVFCADGDTEVMVTDILYPGIYAVDGLAITGFFEDGGEISEDLSFEILSDETIRDSDYGYTWQLDTEGRFTQYACREGGG